MSLVRLEPYKAMRRARSLWPELDRMRETIERFMGESPFEEESWYPQCDIIEREKEFLVRCELPGLETKDVKVELKDNILTISGERREAEKAEGEYYHRMECSHGRFSRSFTLPQVVDAESVEAVCKSGILEIHLPKSEAAIPKQITVKAA